MLEYMLGDSSIYLFLVSQQDIVTHKVALDFDVKTLVSDMRQAITDMMNLEIERAIATQNYISAARALYDSIFQPIAHRIIPRYKKLIIIPDGELSDLPFDALLKERPDDIEEFSEFAYLVKDLQISYNYSATLLEEMEQKKHVSPKSRELWLGVAPEFTGRPLQDVPNLKLAPLVYNKEEIDSIKKKIGGAVLVGDKARETSVLQQASNYKILHLSTHGQADSIIGENSFLAFSEIPNGVEDEILFTRELYNQRLNNDLVVLSACETGIGELRRGEGVISLSRGFSYAGAKSIVTSLWQVKELPTKELLTSFYNKLIAQELSKGEALRQAKLEMINSEGPEPYYWAGFIPIGDMSPIASPKKDRSIWLWLILGLLTIGISARWFYR